MDHALAKAVELLTAEITTGSMPDSSLPGVQEAIATLRAGESNDQVLKILWWRRKMTRTTANETGQEDDIERACAYYDVLEQIDPEFGHFCREDSFHYP